MTMDQIGEFRRMQNKDVNETFAQSTDSLEALRDFLAGGGSTGGGGWYYGVVTGVPGANQFTIATLAGLGNTKFQAVAGSYYWNALVFRDAGGAGAAPQGEQQVITAYVSAGGVFTTNAFSAAVDLGDEILIVPRFLADVLTILSLMNKPAADAVGNDYIRDVIGNKADTALYAATATASLMRYVKAMLHADIIASGTLSASSATVPADNTRAEANDFFNGCLLMPVAGACAFEPKLITDFTAVTGVFAIDGFNPFSAATGLVAYVIIRNQSSNDLLQSMRGGAESLESLDDELDAMLDLSRSPDSGTTTMDGNELTLYEENAANPFEFGGGFIDLGNMQAGDTIRIRVYVIIAAGGVYRQLSDDVVNTYVGVQAPRLKQIEGFYNQYGVKVTAEQTAGVNRDVPHEWFDAKRGS